MRALILCVGVVGIALSSALDKPQSAAAATNPLDIVVLIDNSDSMALQRPADWCRSNCPPPNDPQGFRFSAAKFLTQVAGDDDRLAFAVFDDGASTLVELSRAGPPHSAARDEMRTRIDAGRARTTGLTTSFASGLEAAAEVFAQGGTSAGRRVVIVLTDALSRDVESPQSLVSRGRALNSAVYVVALGSGADLSFADSLAAATGAVSFPAATPAALIRAFADIVTHLYPDLYVDELTGSALHVSPADEIGELLFVFPGRHPDLRLHPEGVRSEGACGVWSAVATLTRCPSDPNYHSIQLSDRSRGLSGDWLVEGSTVLGGFVVIRSAISLRPLFDSVPAGEPWLLAFALERVDGPIRDTNFSARVAVRSGSSGRQVQPLRLTAYGPAGEPMLWTRMEPSPPGTLSIEVSLGIADRPIRLRRHLTLRAAPVAGVVSDFQFHEAIDDKERPHLDTQPPTACARDEYTGQVVEVAGGRHGLVSKGQPHKVRPDDRPLLSGELETGSPVAVAPSDRLRATVRVTTLRTLGRPPTVAGTIAPLTSEVSWDRETACTWVGQLTLSGLSAKHPQNYDLSLSFPDLPAAGSQSWQITVPEVLAAPQQPEVELGTVYLTLKDNSTVLTLRFDRPQESPPNVQLGWDDPAQGLPRLLVEALDSEDSHVARYRVSVDDGTWMFPIVNEDFSGRVRLAMAERYRVTSETVDLTWRRAGVLDRFGQVLFEPRILSLPFAILLPALFGVRRLWWNLRHPRLVGELEIGGRSVPLDPFRRAWVAVRQGNVVITSHRPKDWLLELRGQLRPEPATLIWAWAGTAEVQKLSPDGREMQTYQRVFGKTALPKRARLRIRHQGIDAAIAYRLRSRG